MSLEGIPEEVTPDHQRRPACVYVRLEQYPTTPRDQAERERQWGQCRHAGRWGWYPEQVLGLEDLGKCGCLSEAREGFGRLLQMVRDKQLGLVLVSDFDRLATTWDDVLEILALCRDTGTLLAVDGVVALYGDSILNLLIRLRSARAAYKRLEAELRTHEEELRRAGGIRA